MFLPYVVKKTYLYCHFRILYKFCYGILIELTDLACAHKISLSSSAKAISITFKTNPCDRIVHQTQY